jgi:hypothetical protein
MHAEEIVHKQHQLDSVTASVFLLCSLCILYPSHKQCVCQGDVHCRHNLPPAGTRPLHCAWDAAGAPQHGVTGCCLQCTRRCNKKPYKQRHRGATCGTALPLWCPPSPPPLPPLLPSLTSRRSNTSSMLSTPRPPSPSGAAAAAAAGVPAWLSGVPCCSGPGPVAAECPRTPSPAAGVGGCVGAVSCLSLQAAGGRLLPSPACVCCCCCCCCLQGASRDQTPTGPPAAAAAAAAVMGWAPRQG